MAAKLNKSQILELKGLNSFGEGGTTWPKKDAVKFEKFGYVELGNDVGESDVQIRINAAGVEFINSLDNESSGEQNNDQSGTVAEEKKSTGGKPMFQIQSNVEIPEAPKRTRQSAYPFDKLEVGQSFFVPATEERPEPAKTLASTVSAANERHSEVIEGQSKVNRKGNLVPATRRVRQFTVRPVEDGAPWGFAGQAGAGVWRIEPTDAEAEEGAEA